MKKETSPYFKLDGVSYHRDSILQHKTEAAFLTAVNDKKEGHPTWFADDENREEKLKALYKAAQPDAPQPEAKKETVEETSTPAAEIPFTTEVKKETAKASDKGKTT